LQQELADEILYYDDLNQHVQTSVGSTAIKYTRDASGRIIQRDSTVAGSTTTIRYLYAGAGDAAWGTASSSGVLAQHKVAVPGGATMLVNVGSPGTRWSYPNLHGDEIVSADNAGVRGAGHASYDPFGEPIDPATGNIDLFLFDYGVWPLPRTEGTGLEGPGDYSGVMYRPDTGKVRPVIVGIEVWDESESSVRLGFAGTSTCGPASSRVRVTRAQLARRRRRRGPGRRWVWWP
jgi:hypothetical protein